MIAAADPDASVVAGRQALDRWWDYNWYDDAADGVRRIDVAPPRNWDWGNFNWDFSSLEFIWHLLVWSAIAVVLGLIVWLLWRHFRQRGPSDSIGGRGRDSADDDRARIESLPFPVRSARLDLLDEARRHYQAGDYGRAIVYLFSYELVQLDKGQVIRLAKGKTNRQYLREVGPRRPLRGLVEQTMVAFEDVYFGDRLLSRQRFESCWQGLGEFQQLTEQKRD